MGESLLTLGVSGNVWFDPAYAGIALALVVGLLCVWQFVRRRWAGLLFWSGAAFGALLGQGYALWQVADASSFSLWTNGAIGAVLGMLAGGLLADWWQGRQPAHDVPPAPIVAADVRRQRPEEQFVIEVDDYAAYDAEAV